MVKEQTFLLFLLNNMIKTIGVELSVLYANVNTIESQDMNAMIYHFQYDINCGDVLYWKTYCMQHIRHIK